MHVDFCPLSCIIRERKGYDCRLSLTSIILIIATRKELHQTCNQMPLNVQSVQFPDPRLCKKAPKGLK